MLVQTYLEFSALARILGFSPYFLHNCNSIRCQGFLAENFIHSEYGPLSFGRIYPYSIVINILLSMFEMGGKKVGQEKIIPYHTNLPTSAVPALCITNIHSFECVREMGGQTNPAMQTRTDHPDCLFLQTSSIYQYTDL